MGMIRIIAEIDAKTLEADQARFRRRIAFRSCLIVPARIANRWPAMQSATLSNRPEHMPGFRPFLRPMTAPFLLLLLAGCSNPASIQPDIAANEADPTAHAASAASDTATSLPKLAAGDDLEALRLWLRSNPKPDGEIQAKSMNAAVYAGKPEMLDALLAAGFGPDTLPASRMGGTALMAAAYSDAIPMLERLRLAGATLDLPDHNGDPAINWAAYAGHLAAVRWLLDHQARADLVGHGNALQIAERRGHQALIALLCERQGCNPDPDPTAARIAAAIDADDLPALTRELANAADPAALRDETGRPLLHRAARQGRTTALRALLDAGVPVDQLDSIGFTALGEACRDGRIEAVELLLARGADIDHIANPSALSLTPLHQAAIGGHDDIVHLLAVHGANLDAVDRERTTPALWALSENHAQTARLLQQLGADLSIVGNYGYSAAQLLPEKPGR